mmetsp:Transcript_15777/g.26505  ORF Transcript_15777/g.26505 Transcript_15777/m.26505 type:complete len:285 (+) Transcript_15777:434-1288(+)
MLKVRVELNCNIQPFRTVPEPFQIYHGWAKSADLEYDEDGVPRHSVYTLSKNVVQAFSTLQAGWTLHHCEGRFDNGWTDSDFSVSIRAERDAFFYLVTFGGLIFIVVASSILALGVDPQDLADRMSINMTLLLTVVAFKLVMSSYVPPTPYLTRLDTYMLTGLVILATVILENFLVSFLSEEAAKDIDITFGLLVAIFWFGLHVWIIFAQSNDLFVLDWDTVMAGDDAGHVPVYGLLMDDGYNHPDPEEGGGDAYGAEGDGATNPMSTSSMYPPGNAAINSIAK